MIRTLSRFLAAFAVVFVSVAAFAQMSPINNPAPALPIVPITQYGVQPSSTAAQVTTAVNAAIADCNAGNIGGIFFPTGSWRLLSNPSTLLAPCAISGAGPTTLITFPGTDASSATTPFTVGDDTHRVARTSIHDLSLVWQNAPDANTFAFDVRSVTDMSIYNITFTNGVGWLRIGSATAPLSPNRVFVSNLGGDVNNALNNDCIVNVIAGVNLYFKTWTLNGSGVSDTNPTGAVMCLVPQQAGTQGFIDTITLDDVVTQVFNNPTFDHSKPYGLLIDTSVNNINNLHVIGATQFDHTSVAGIEERCVVGGAGYAHVHHFEGTRISTDTGSAIVVDGNCGTDFSRISFDSVHVFVRDANIPIQILAAHDGGSTNYASDKILGLGALDFTGGAITSVVAVGAPGWLINDSTAGGNLGGATGFQYLYSITNAAASPSQFGHAYNMPSSMGFLTAPFWGTGGALPQNVNNIVKDTTSSGAVSTGNYLFTFPAMTVNATSATTYAKLDTMHIDLPIAGTNTTITLPVALELPNIAFSGNITAASWGLSGLGVTGVAPTYTDSTASGTIAAEAAFAFPATNIAATNAATTITDLVELYLPTPSAGSNVTATNIWSLRAAAGIKTAGLIQGNSGLTINGAVAQVNVSSNFNTTLNGGTSSGTITLGNSGNTGKTVLAGLATGTNADSICLSAANVVLIQAAACTISSRRFKENIDPWGGDALSELVKLPTFTFDLKDGKTNKDKNAARTQIGIMAEDVARIEPKCALYDPDMKTPKSYRQECVIAMLIKSVQQLSASNDNLKQLVETENRFVGGIDPKSLGLTFMPTPHCGPGKFHGGMFKELEAIRIQTPTLVGLANKLPEPIAVMCPDSRIIFKSTATKADMEFALSEALRSIRPTEFHK